MSFQIVTNLEKIFPIYFLFFEKDTMYKWTHVVQIHVV